jgi:hypothetical protein
MRISRRSTPRFCKDVCVLHRTNIWKWPQSLNIKTTEAVVDASRCVSRIVSMNSGGTSFSFLRGSARDRKLERRRRSFVCEEIDAWWSLRDIVPPAILVQADIFAVHDAG